jgi:hypothetical protein
MPVKSRSKEAKSDWKVSEEVQKAVLGHISDELKVAIRNNEKVNDDFELYNNMIHGIREDKVNDWESDIFLPEFSSRLLTTIGIFCAQYFASTDYVENDVDSDDPKDIAEAKAAKFLLNSLLKDPEAYYFHKVVRWKMYQNTCGYAIIKGGYKQQVTPVVSHYVQESDFARDPVTGDYLAEDGSVYLDPTFQKPKFDTFQKAVYKNNVIKDTPVFDVYPVQSVYMSPEYTYSLNDKQYVIFETEKTLDELRAEASEFNYFNLDKLDEEDPQGKLGEKTYNRDGKTEEQPEPVTKTFIVYERWGKYPVVEKDGVYVPAIDEDGDFDEEADNKECIIYYAKNREQDDVRHIIGFRLSPHSKRPMVRFLCYVDMVNDNGFGDGEVNRELQKAVNDNYNLMNYRSKLAITPAFKGRKFSGIPENVRISPEQVVMMENIDTDLKEIIIQDNIQGGVVHHNLLSSRMDFAMATSPQTMGMPSDRAETATVGAITNQRATLRSGMKSMNDEFIGFTEFYEMLLTLVDDFMLPETLEEILGDMATDYRPRAKNKFKPVSQALETEESKQFKLKTWQGILQMIPAMPPNPKTPQIFNMIVGQMLELMGGQFKQLKKFMFEDNPDAIAMYQMMTGAKMTVNQTAPAPQGGMMPQPQNQTGLPQRPPEQMARSMAPGQQQRG